MGNKIKNKAEIKSVINPNFRVKGLELIPQSLDLIH